MTNILDYLRWRGDLSFFDSGFNEVDNLVFSMCSFLELEGFAPADFSSVRPTLRDAVAWYENIHGGSSYLGLLIPEKNMDIMRLAAASHRFEDVCICGYRNHIDKAVVTQFSATTYLLPDGTVFIAFRGTDDTVVGWKENMNLCLEHPVPAEEEAVTYLTEAAGSLCGSIRLGGHSKGGHLAIRAAADSQKWVQERLTAVYSNDGPGFLPAFFSSPGYRNVREKCVTFIPQSSIVGTLLEQDEEHCTLIHSAETGVMQHNPISWDVECKAFLRLDRRSRFGMMTDSALKSWILGMAAEERKTIIDSLFSIFDAPGMDTLTEIDRAKLRSGMDTLHALRGQSPETRKMVLRLYRRLFQPAADRGKEKETKDEK